MVTSSVSRARTLRRSMTGVELLLWSRLRQRQIGGHRFRRQAPIGPFIADFACFQARLLIEIDGPTHDDRAEYDDRRSAWLVRRGFRVLRFSADEVLSRLDDVLETILVELADSAGPPPPARPGTPPTARPDCAVRLRGGETSILALGRGSDYCCYVCECPPSETPLVHPRNR